MDSDFYGTMQEVKGRLTHCPEGKPLACPIGKGYNNSRHESGVLMRILALALAFCGVSLAQTVSTQILGLITDRTGAVITGATVKARRVATGDVR